MPDYSWFWLQKNIVYTAKWMCDSQHEIWSPQNYSLVFPSFFPHYSQLSLNKPNLQI